jgi:hypothetical protein
MMLLTKMFAVGMLMSSAKTTGLMPRLARSLSVAFFKAKQNSIVEWVLPCRSPPVLRMMECSVLAVVGEVPLAVTGGGDDDGGIGELELKQVGRHVPELVLVGDHIGEGLLIDGSVCVGKVEEDGGDGVGRLNNLGSGHWPVFEELAAV